MTRERVYFLYDIILRENVYKKPDLNDVQKEVRRLNKKEGYQRYRAKGGWVIHKLP